MRDAGLSIKAWMDINDNDYEKVWPKIFRLVQTNTQCRDALDGYVKWTGIVQHKTDPNCDVRWRLGRTLMCVFHLLFQDWTQVHHWRPRAIWWRMVQVILRTSSPNNLCTVSKMVDKLFLQTSNWTPILVQQSAKYSNMKIWCVDLRIHQFLLWINP